MTKPLTIRGVEYPSQAAAALALGVSRATIHAAARDPQSRLDRVGLGPAKGATVSARNACPITIQGVTYATRKDAAAALGVNPSQISGIAKVLCQPAQSPPVIIGGVSYPKISAAADALGVTPSEIRAWVRVQAKISA